MATDFSLRSHGATDSPNGSDQHTDTAIRHGETTIDGVRTFFREAGDQGAPVLLLPHGYPCSSYQYRNLMPALADRWRTLAPDFPGFGYSDTPVDFRYDFDGYAAFLERCADHWQLDRFALYLHDYGSQIGLRLAMRAPERIAALIIQNGDIYEDQLGPKYAAIQRYWNEPSAAHRQVLEHAICENGFRDEFIGEIADALQRRVAPDLWKLHWPLMDTPLRRRIALDLMTGLKDNLAWFPRYQAYLRARQLPALIVWGEQDGYMPAPAATAYRRDLPLAELHLLDGGHWLLETHLQRVIPLIRDFLRRVFGSAAA